MFITLLPMRLRVSLISCLLLLAAFCFWSPSPVLAQGGPTPLPPCPPIGEGTPVPGPADVSWDYLARCAHCVALTPTATNPYIPSPTLAMYEFSLDCPSSRSLEVSGALGNEVILYDHNQYAGIYGVAFDVYRPAEFSPGSGQMWLSRVLSHPSDYVNLLGPEFGGLNGVVSLTSDSYCLIADSAHASLCASLVPGADVVSMNDGSGYYPEASSSRPFALTVGQQGFAEGVDLPRLDNIRLLYYGAPRSCAYEGPTYTPTPAASGFFRSCSSTVSLVHAGGLLTQIDTHYTLDLWRYSSAFDVAAVVFNAVVPEGMSLRGLNVGHSEDVSFFDASVDSYGPLSDGLYCIGTYAGCAYFSQQIPAVPITYIENRLVDITEEPVLWWGISGVPGTVTLTNYQLVVSGSASASELDCGSPEVTSTPSPTVTPTLTPGPTSTSLPACNLTWSPSLSSATNVYNIAGGLPTWSLLSAVKMAALGTATTNYGYYRPVAAIQWNAATAINTVQIKVSDKGGGYLQAGDFNIYWTWSDGGSWFERSGCSSSGGPTEYTISCTVAGEHLAGVKSRLENIPDGQQGNIEYEIVSCNGLSVPPETTPTPTPTETPQTTPTVTPTITPTPSLMPSPTPLVDWGANQCIPYEWQDDTPVIEVPPDWDDDITEFKDCYPIWGAADVSIGPIEVGGITLLDDNYSLTLPGFAICVTEVHAPQLTIVGVVLNWEWFLIPLYYWILLKLSEG